MVIAQAIFLADLNAGKIVFEGEKHNNSFGIKP